MAATRLIPLHKINTRSAARCLKDKTDYIQNPDKTEGGELISSYECDPELVEDQFAVANRIYRQRTGKDSKGIIGYHIRQSFKPGEITAEEANRIGYETAMRFTKGEHAFIVATHTDRAHIHNHVIYNAVNLGCDKKFRNFYNSSFVLQRLSDMICLENGLSVITPQKSGERTRRSGYPKRNIKERQVNLLVDIQKKISEGKGIGYEKWARSFNRKQISKTLLFLKDKGVTDYETLERLTGDATGRFRELTDLMKESEKRLKEIAGLKKAIVNYSKMRTVYDAYRRSGFSKKFFEDHREELTLYKAAKETFGKIEGDSPSYKELTAEYETVLSKKREAYAEYKKIKKDMQDLLIAKRNIDMVLGKESESRDMDREEEKSKKQNRNER